eukprot:GEMP01092985.1.p1 GENE.GEMP01092985.1~~GEMP01092985.1.p1  ORF type:complete len:103 (-),score=2.81 GEMP01092985.1:476-784(-)
MRSMDKLEEIGLSPVFLRYAPFSVCLCANHLFNIFFEGEQFPAFFAQLGGKTSSIQLPTISVQKKTSLNKKNVLVTTTLRNLTGKASKQVCHNNKKIGEQNN